MIHPQSSSQPAVKLVIRLPALMRVRLAEVAQANHRSMNSEIITILERALAPQASITKQDAE